MASPLDTPTAVASSTHSFTVGAGTDRCLIVGLTGEGTQVGDHTCTYGGEAMTHVVASIAGSGTTQQTVTLFYLNDAGIVAASGTTITPGNVPTDLSIHAASYQDAMQTTPTNTDTDNSAASTPNPLAACDIVTGAADAVVCALSGMGNAGSAAWGLTLTERTDQATASANGSYADDEVPSATTIACECTWTTQNRAAISALELENSAAAPGISDVVPTTFDMDESTTPISVNGLGFEATQTTGTIYLSDANTLAGSANEVDISSAVSSWTDIKVVLDMTALSAAEIDELQTLGPGQRFIIILTSIPNEYASTAITLHRPQAFQMVLGAATPGVTTARLTGMTGTFGGGRIEEVAAQNPSTTNTDVADDGNREDVWSIEGVPASREVSYMFRVLYGGNVPDTITETPNITIAALDGATWIAAKDVALTGIDVNTNYDARVRIEVNNSGANAKEQAFKWRYSRNSGVYADITASSNHVQTVLTNEFADGDDVVDNLLAASPLDYLDNNAAEEDTGTFTMGEDFGAGTIEAEISFRLVSADLSNGDTIDFRLYDVSGSAVLDTYTTTPRITVVKDFEDFLPFYPKRPNVLLRM